jgi:hypothetical protein
MTGGAVGEAGPPFARRDRARLESIAVPGPFVGIVEPGGAGPPVMRDCANSGSMICCYYDVLDG